jgi:hypothetical protein
VTPRTIRYWISGKVLVPYAAYKLVRVMRLFELPCAGWDGWHMHSGRLWSPEGHGFLPGDSDWWGMLVRKAALFKPMYDRANQLDVAMQRMQGLVSGAVVPVAACVAGAAGDAASLPADAVGRAAKPTGPNLLLEHFRKYRYRAESISLGKPAFLPATNTIAPVSSCEKSGVTHG